MFNLEEVSPELQMELTDFQCNDVLKDKFRKTNVINFFKRLPEERCAQIGSFACGCGSVFCAA
jgi:hypothetical protein